MEKTEIKLAYILTIEIIKYEGVLIKVKSQITSWIEQGIDVKLFIITSKPEDINKSQSLKDLKKFTKLNAYKNIKYKFIYLENILYFLNSSKVINNLIIDIQNFNPSLIYTRSNLNQPFLKELKSSTKIIMEINMDIFGEYRFQAFKSLKFFLRYIIFKLKYKNFLKGIDGLVTVTHEISKRYSGFKCKVIPNSIQVDRYPTLSNSNYKEKRVVFIGTPGMDWHGLDILIKIADKLPKIQFDIIGISKDQISEKNKNLSNIHFYGYLSKVEYLKIFEKSCVAIDSLACFRANMNESSTLKLREYLACCIPIIISCNDSAFIGKKYPKWILKLENNEEKILNSIDQIESFINISNKFDIRKDDVRQFIDTSVIEKERVQFFKKILDES